MARTFEDIQRQIEKLQQEAAGIKAREVAGVIKGIRASIASYSLTPDDLFGSSSAPLVTGTEEAATQVKKPGAKLAANLAAKPATKQVKKAANKVVVKPAIKQMAAKVAKKTASVIKFKDPVSGKTWTGNGTRPGWYLKAIEDGKTPEDLAVK
jgi:DNA-binding protein H-NS